MADFHNHLFAVIDGYGIMLGAITVAIIAGFVAGLHLTVGALMALCFLLLPVAIGLSLYLALTFWQGVLFVFGLMIVLQISYFGAVFVSVLKSRGKGKGRLRSLIKAIRRQDEAR